MLGVGIKNALLMLLIILILHFLIKNVLVEQRSYNMKTEKPKVEVKDLEDDIQIRDNIPTIEQNKADKKDELLKFVMDDEGEAKTNLEKFFEPIANEEAFDDSYNIACDANLDTKKVIENSMKAPKKPNEQNANNFLIIHEYNNENVMNGGSLGGLGGYDEYDSHYESYSSSCAK